MGQGRTRRFSRTRCECVSAGAWGGGRGGGGGGDNTHELPPVTTKREPQRQDMRVGGWSGEGMHGNGMCAACAGECWELPGGVCVCV
jgi:hypothetical protein